MIRSARRLPLSVAVMAAVMWICGCASSTAHSASSLLSPGGGVVSPSTPLVGFAPPQWTVCQRILSAADLAGVAAESDAVVEGTSPDKTSVFNDADASQFQVTKVLKALPGVDPSGMIEIVFGPPDSGDFLPAGNYLLFLLSNPIGKDYTIADSSLGNVVTNAEFQVNGDTATEKGCVSRSDDGAAPSAVASWNAIASAPPLSAAALEGWVGQLTLGKTLASPVASPVRSPVAGVGSPAVASSVGSIGGVVKVAASQSSDRPRTTQAGAQMELENSIVFGEEPIVTVPHLELARVTVSQGPALPNTWNDRLAWVVALDTPVVDSGTCPIPPATPDPTPAGPQQHIYAADATGIGDGIVYTGPGISCGRDVPATTDPLAHLWSAPWHVTATGPTSVTLGYQPPPCGTEYQIGAVSLQPYQIAMLYAVPFSNQDCPSPTPAPQTLTVPGNYLNPTPAPPNIEQPRFGYVRLTTNGLLPELPE